MLGEDIEDEEQRGIIPRMVKGIFAKIIAAPEDIEFSMRVSFIEIYNEKIKDLLDPKKVNLKIHENKEKGIYIKDMTESYVASEDEVYGILKIGNDNRSIGVTNMNKQSSRSHSCFVMQVEQKNLTDFSSKTGKIYLVDLAGSERISKTGAEGETLTEAQNINKSLTSLGNVINALTDGKSTHVPYRDSKLTRMLQESLGGNSKTSLIITCSPSSFNKDETVSTLRFGQRAKQIKNKAKVNKEFSINELKYMLQAAEKEIRLKDKRILCLEEYIEVLEEKLLSGAPVDREALLVLKERVKKEGKKIEQQIARVEESKAAEAPLPPEVDDEEEEEEDDDEEDEPADTHPEESSDDEQALVVDSRLQPSTIDSAENIGAPALGDKLDPDYLNASSKAEQEMDLKEKQLDEEIRKN